MRTERFDLWGFVTVATGLVALLLAFSEGHSWGWTSYRVLILIAGGALMLALFVVIEFEVDHPLLDLRVFRSRAYTVSLIVMSVMMTGLFATLFYVPLFLQAGQGYPALNAGLLILPQALVMGFLMPIAGRLYDQDRTALACGDGAADRGLRLVLARRHQPRHDAQRDRAMDLHPRRRGRAGDDADHDGWHRLAQP